MSSRRPPQSPQSRLNTLTKPSTQRSRSGKRRGSSRFTAGTRAGPPKSRKRTLWERKGGNSRRQSLAQIPAGVYDNDRAVVSVLGLQPQPVGEDVLDESGLAHPGAAQYERVFPDGGLGQADLAPTGRSVAHQRAGVPGVTQITQITGTNGKAHDAPP